MNFRERLQIWVDQRGSWARILIGVAISALILIIAMASCVPSKGVVSTNVEDIADTRSTVATVIESVGTKASQATLEAFEQDINQALGTQAGSISDNTEEINIAKAKLAQARSDITALQGQINSTMHDSLSASLAGTFGNYTLCVKSDEPGNFMAKVHLAYQPAIGNATSYTAALEDLYSTVTWAGNSTVPQYVVVPTCHNTTWGVAEVWWSVGEFTLVADTEAALNITCAGLGSAWEPDYAYVEVYEAW